MDMYQKRNIRKKAKTENNSIENSSKININWYPGHMAKAEREIKSMLKFVDIIIEVLDARIPKSSKNPNVSNFSQNKAIIVILNKADLADEQALKKWIDFYENLNIPVVCTNCEKEQNIKQVISKINEVGQNIYQKKSENSRVDMNYVYKVAVLGIPNVGKSTLINKLCGKSSAKVSDTPGVTRMLSWLKVGKNIEILDTPGILAPKFDGTTGINLALTGNIKQGIIDDESLAMEAIKILISNDKYKKMLFEKYNIDLDEFEQTKKNINSEQNSEQSIEYSILKLIGKKRGCLIKGEVDMTRTSTLVVNDLKSGKIGRISIE